MLSPQRNKGVQWLDSRSKGCKFETRQGNSVVTLSKTLYPLFNHVSRKIHPNITDWYSELQWKQKRIFKGRSGL